MNWLHQLRLRFRALSQKEKLDAQMDEEMRSHIEMQTQENIEAGMKPEEARYAALRQFGRVEAIKETCREQRGVSWIENLGQDIRYAARMLRKNPGFTAVAVLTLALGIGATASVFSLIHGVLLTPPPYPNPEQVALIVPAKADGQAYPLACTTEQWFELQKATNSFEAIAGYQWNFEFVVLSDGSELAKGLFVTPDYFKVIGVKPLLGRGFSEADMATPGGEETTIILGYNLWHRRFNGDPNIIGKVVRLSRLPPLTVVGVMPPGVRLLPSAVKAREVSYDVNAQVDFWVPLWPPDLKKPREGYCEMVGRLRDGVTPTRAQVELTTIAARQAQANGDFEGSIVQARPLAAELNREGRRLLLPASGAVTLVFLMACANVAGLMLARGLQRQHEQAVRCALGAGRAALFREVLVESSLLALIGAASGLALASGCLVLLKSFAAHAVPRLDAVHIGWPVTSFCLIAAFVSAAIAGLLPAWRAAHLNPCEALKNGSRSGGIGRMEGRFLKAIAAGQTALTLALLLGAGLLIRTVNHLAAVPLGFRTGNILTMNVTDMNLRNFFGFHDQAISRISALPGVEKVAFAWGVPLTGNKWLTAIRIEGESTSARPQDALYIPSRSVTPEFFGLLDQTILLGRNFPSEHSVETNRIVMPFTAIVNEAMAKKHFANGNPVGRKLLIPGREDKPVEIIGVVSNARTESMIQAPEPEIYYCMWEKFPFTKHLLVQTSSDPKMVAASVQRELRAIEPTVAIENVKTLQGIRDESVASQTFAMRLLVAFALMASALACIGIYGVLSLTVGARRREIAIRIALGAQRRIVLGSVASEAMRVVVVGALLGIALAIALSRVLASLLFGVAATDPLTWGAMTLVLIGIVLLASWLPVRRAIQVDPMEALRHE